MTPYRAGRTAGSGRTRDSLVPFDLALPLQCGRDAWPSEASDLRRGEAAEVLGTGEERQEERTGALGSYRPSPEFLSVSLVFFDF